MLSTCYDADPASGPLRLLQKQMGEREREREQWPSQGHLLFGCTKTLELREFVPAWFTPGPFSSAHIYTPLSPSKSCLNDIYLLWTTENFYLNNRGKRSKRNNINSTFSDQSHWTLNGNMDVRSPTRTKQTKKKTTKKKLFKNWIEDCRRRSFCKMVWVCGQLTFEDQFVWLEMRGDEIPCHRTSVGDTMFSGQKKKKLASIWDGHL